MEHQTSMYEPSLINKISIGNCSGIHVGYQGDPFGSIKIGQGHQLCILGDRLEIFCTYCKWENFGWGTHCVYFVTLGDANADTLEYYRIVKYNTMQAQLGGNQLRAAGIQLWASKLDIFNVFLPTVIGSTGHRLLKNYSGIQANLCIVYVSEL